MQAKNLVAAPKHSNLLDIQLHTSLDFPSTSDDSKQVFFNRDYPLFHVTASDKNMREAYI